MKHLFASLVLALVLTGPLVAQRVVTPTETLRIGSIDGPDALGFPGLARITSDGDVFVLFAEESYIQRFSLDGEFLERLGRPGAGPGEFFIGRHMEMHGPRLWVMEEFRVSEFNVETGDVRTFVPHRHERGLAGGPKSPEAILPSGEIVFRQVPRYLDMVRSRAPLLLLDTAGELSDTVALLHHESSMVYRNPSSNSGQLWKHNPFPLSDLWATHRAIPGIVVVDTRTRREHGEVRVRTLLTDGTVWDSTVVRTVAEPAISDEEWDEVAATIVPSLVRVGETIGIASESDARRRFRETFKDVRYRNAALDVHVASDGLVWIEGPSTNYMQPGWSGDMTILSPQLDLLARVKLPEGMRFLDAHNRTIWAVDFDEFFVSYLVKMELPEDWLEGHAMRNVP